MRLCIVPLVVAAAAWPLLFCRDGRAGAPAVTVVGADANATLTIDAPYGVVDEPLTLVAGAEATKTPLAVSISYATAGTPDEVPVRVALLLAPAGPQGIREAFGQASESVSVALGPGQRQMLRLLAPRLDRAVAYRSVLTVGEQTYVLRFKSGGARSPLGLHAVEWVQTFPVALGDSQLSATTCLPTDRPPGESVSVSLLAPATPRAESQRFEPSSVKVAGSAPCGSNAALLTIGSLKSGRYDATIDIEGERLNVQLTCRASLWLVALLIAAGTSLSALARLLVNHFERSAGAAEQVATYEREGRQFAFALDARDADVKLQFARGCDRAFLGDLVPKYLEAARAVPEKRAAVDAITERLAASPLPEGVRLGVERELRELRRLSALSDRDAVDAGLAALAKEAETGFSARFAAWLIKLRERVASAEQDFSPILQDGAALTAAVDGLEQFVEDAQMFAGQGRAGRGIDREYVQLLERVDAALQWLRKMYERNDRDLEAIEDALARAWFFDFSWAPEGPPSADPQRVETRSWKIDPGASPARAFEPITFTVEGVHPTLQPRLRFLWQIGAAEAFEGGPRVTALFAKAGGEQRRRVSVRVAPMDPATLTLLAPDRSPCAANEHELFWEGEVLRPKSDLADKRRIAWVAQKGQLAFGLLVGITVASLYALDRPFGTTWDQVALLLTGIGIDVASSGSPLKGAIEWVRARTTK